MERPWRIAELPPPRAERIAWRNADLPFAWWTSGAPQVGQTRDQPPEA